VLENQSLIREKLGELKAAPSQESVRPPDGRDAGQIAEETIFANQFQHLCALEAERLGAVIDGSKGVVSLTFAQMEQYSALRSLQVIETFVRLQRMSGVRTVRWTDVPGGSSHLADRIVTDGRLARPEDLAHAAQILDENVVDIRPLVDERLRAVCNGDRQAFEFSQ